MKKTQTCTLYVQGMHCGACEILIEKKLQKIDGVKSVDASLSKKKVIINYSNGKLPPVEELNKAVHEHGYTFTEDPVGKVKFDQLSVFKAITVFIIFTLMYIILEDTKLLARFSVTESSGVPAFFVLGVVAGVSSCAALVGGLLLSLSKQWNQLYGGVRSSQAYVPFVLFNVGRLISFALLGALLGLVGSFLQFSITATSFLVLFVSFFMIIIGLQMLEVPWFRKLQLHMPKFLTRKISDEERFHGKYMSFIVGASTFFLPCGFTLMAQTLALTTGSMALSSLMMFSFALGTLPMLGIISFSSLKFQKNTSVAGTFNLIVALFIVLFGLYNVNSQLNVLGVWSLHDIASAPVQNDQVSPSLGANITEKNGKQLQHVTIEARGFEYFPRNLRLKADIPTELTVQNYDVLGCARAMYSAGLFEEVLYLQGETSQTSFTPKKGQYKISCSMGMVQPIIVEVI